ncbi:MAG: hypothetical protein WD226_03525 [Planctomycetota bacterium]
MPKLLVALASLFATLFLLEGVALLILEPPHYVWIYPFDAELGFRAFPRDPLPFRDEHGSFLQTWNSRGYRGPEYPEHPESDGETILFVGDSFVQGYGVRDERMAHAVVERAFLDAGQSARCFTASGDSFGTVQELLLLRRVRADVRPDRVVLVFYSGNDVINNAPSLAGRTNASAGDYVRPYLAADGSVAYLHPWRAALRARSRLFGRVEAHLFHNGFVETAPDAVTRDVDERIALGLLPAEQFRLLAPEPDERWRAARRATEAALLRFQAEVEAAGAQFFVAIVPDVAQVQRMAHFADLDARTVAAGQRRLAERLDFDAPEAWLVPFFERAGIEHLACVEPLRALVDATGRSVYQSDGHLNGRGQECVGALIAQRLLGQETQATQAVGGPVDLLERTLSTNLVDYTKEPFEETVLSGLVPAEVQWDDAALPALRMLRGAARFSTPGRAGLLAVAGVARGAAADRRGLALDGMLYPLRADGCFWITLAEAASADPHVRALVRSEGDLWLTGYALAPADALLGDEARACFERLTHLSSVELEAFFAALPARGQALLEGGHADEGERLAGFWKLHAELSALHALTTGPFSKRVAALEAELRAHVAPLVRALGEELDDADFAAWALALGEPDLLAAAEQRLSSELSVVLAKLRDRIALLRGARQPYGTIGVETADGWFGPPCVAPADLARNRNELGLELR